MNEMQRDMLFKTAAYQNHYVAVLLVQVMFFTSIS